MKHTQRMPKAAGITFPFLQSVFPRRFFGENSQPGAFLSLSACSLIAALLSSASVLAQDTDTPSHLGPFEVQLRTNNPLRESVNKGFRPTPVALDFDRDGDVDVVAPDFDGGEGFPLLRNDGTRTQPQFNYALYWSNPFNYIAFDDGATPAFTDIDNDGDDDMLLGILDGTFRFYKNNPSTTYKYSLQTGAWNAAAKTGNPFHGIDLGAYASPVFTDFDNDGDFDVIAGSSYAPNNKSIHYFVNDGIGNFAEGMITGINPALDEVTPALLDADNDGDTDIVLGAADGNLYYFKRVGAYAFEQQPGVSNPFNTFNKGQYSSPSAADFDNDGDFDLIVGVDNPRMDIVYFENKGNGLFEEKTSFENPFGGVDVGQDAAPYFVDYDLDGDQDLLLGADNGTATSISYFENVNGSYKEHITTNPFAGLVVPRSFVPSFVDLDGDGDRDLLGSVDNDLVSTVEFYRNDNGTYVRQPFSSGPFRDISIEAGKSDFADLDDDGDPDMIICERVPEGWDSRYYIRYFKNTGTPQLPVFQQMTGVDNPLSEVEEEFVLFPRFRDIDHDGDLDVVIGEGGNTVEIADGNEFSFYENTGSISNLVFRYRGDLIQQGSSPYEPNPSFVDQDGDGDLDMFIGNSAGQLSFYRNINAPAAATLGSNALNVPSEAAEVAIDPLIALSDADNDSIVMARISIHPFTQGREALTYAPVTGITGNFDAVNGILMFRGKAPLSSYQALLRTVLYQQIAESGSTSGQMSGAPITKTISFTVLDADGTVGTPVSKTLTIGSGFPPVFADHAVTVAAESSAVIQLADLISDSDSDADLSTLSVTQTLSSGAAAVISGSGVLTLNYAGRSFAGVETIGLRVCDLTGNCDDNVITVTVTNTAPAIQSLDLTVVAGRKIELDLKTIISDVENNVDFTSIAIIQAPSSRASAAIDPQQHLVIDYASITFSGTDVLRLRVCDRVGSCSERDVNVFVTNTSPVFAGHAVTIPYGSAQSLDLVSLITDADGNENLGSLTIINRGASGAAAMIDANHFLLVDYRNIRFSGTEQFELEVCDAANSCARALLTISVANNAPQVTPQPLAAASGSATTLNLLDVISDADHNLDLSTFFVVRNPASGAAANIEVISDSEVILRLDYGNVRFSGNDELVVRACDEVNECAEAVLVVGVSMEQRVVVFNAVAPGSSGDNKWMRISNLPDENKVTIFNRWGDPVFTIAGYDDLLPGKRFEGLNGNGNLLPSGTYFYKIEYTDTSRIRKTLTGYLSLKQ